MHIFRKKTFYTRKLFCAQIRNFSQKNGTEKKTGSLAKEVGLLPEDSRNSFLSEKIISFKLQELIDHDKCKHCWLLNRSCSCTPDKDKFETEMKVEFIFYMHPKEFGRGSNTAVVVFDAFLANSKILIAGIKKDEDELQKIIQEQKGSVFVLTPSPKSLFFHEIKKNTNLIIPLRKFTFIVLDGTWDQTKRLAKNEILKDIPHLKLGGAGGTISTLRKQSNFGRVTTAEAVMLLLEEMGFEKEAAFLNKKLGNKIFRAELQRGRIDSRFPHDVSE